MATKKGPVALLREKAKAKATNVHLGTHRAIITRTKSTYAEKHIAFLEHQRAIHGKTVMVGDREIVVDEGGRNPPPADTFRGDGLPDDSLDAIKVPKTAAERAAEDKRKPLTDEMVQGWKPQRYRTKWMIARGL